MFIIDPMIKNIFVYGARQFYLCTLDK